MGGSCLIGLIVASFMGSILSARGLFGSREKLLSLSKQIGTKNPVIARIACFLGFFLCTPIWVGALVVLVGLVRR
jgi:hypothetical protein